MEKIREDYFTKIIDKNVECDTCDSQAEYSIMSTVRGEKESYLQYELCKKCAYPFIKGICRVNYRASKDELQKTIRDKNVKLGVVSLNLPSSMPESFHWLRDLKDAYKRVQGEEDEDSMIRCACIFVPDTDVQFGVSQGAIIFKSGNVLKYREQTTTDFQERMKIWWNGEILVELERD